MPALFYIRLIAFTAGALLYLFLLALIVGHRRPRRFERALFFLILALFFFYSGALLAANAAIHYASPPVSTAIFAMGLVLGGLGFLPGLLVHTEVEYEAMAGAVRIGAGRKILVAAFYLPAVFFLVRIGPQILARPRLDVLWSGGFAATFYGIWMSLALATSAWLEMRASRARDDSSSRRLHIFLGGAFGVLAVLIFYAYGLSLLHRPDTLAKLGAAVVVAGLIPGAVLGYFALRYNFLQIGMQRNLVYAVSAAFLAMLYLALVRRVSGWLEPVLPPEATAAVLLFVLVIFFEPLERVIGRTLYRSFQQRMDRVQRLLVELQTEAQNGDLEKLLSRAEGRIREEFGLSVARLALPRGADWTPLRAPGGLGHCVELPLKNGREEIGVLEACSTGAVLVGETTVALEFLAEQLPTLINHCRLIGEKLRLERELGERERLALVGQMAASISHNLRNPISSMKTVLQALLEERDLTPRVREDCEIVVREMDRLSNKLTQLLRYARPGIRGNDGAGRIAITAITEQVVSLLRRDAERRNVRLEFAADDVGGETVVVGSEEAWTDVISNLVVNAIEAQSDGGKVSVSMRRCGGAMRVEIIDDGPGIAADAGAKLFQPFFTTKPSGTGLGLAIVERRVVEMGGAISWESPVSDGGGTRFVITLPTGKQEADPSPHEGLPS
ncbi:MAG TPA: ATP-binding protein [Candidatus Acidoferrales bacterium]|nr:ATP-binding protein [Candidatus Acidoferrales bacterium]